MKKKERQVTETVYEEEEREVTETIYEEEEQEEWVKKREEDEVIEEEVEKEVVEGAKAEWKVSFAPAFLSERLENLFLIRGGNMIHLPVVGLIKDSKPQEL